MSQSEIDPLQFPYQAAKDLIDRVVTHLEAPKTHALASFLDSSSAFNCTQPHILASSLSDLADIFDRLLAWLVGWLTRRPPRGCVNSTLSKSTEYPQGCHRCYLYFILIAVVAHSSHHL